MCHFILFQLSYSEFKLPQGFVDRRPHHFDEVQFILVTTSLLTSGDCEVREESISIIV